jgi:threonyl-tRNA synthetase
MLQRVYGTAWATKDDLTAYLHRLQEAEKRDHRKLAKLLDLFHMQDEAPGMVFWHPKGWMIWQQVEQYMRQKFIEYDYQEVRTPAVMDRTLWEKSGHWDNYRENMFTTASENRDYAVKPMNCPGHVQIFNSGLHSYRDLPLRLAEFGACHRNEPSGALHGIMRVRGFTQDDAHIFCTEDQIESEVATFIVMLQKVYGDFGFNEVLVKLSTRPDRRVGSDESWDKAEAALDAALRKNGLEFDLQPGEGAFYGPKIEFTLKDSLGRLWQCGTIQLDFNLPVRLGAEYVDEDNARKPPVMLHRAILGSMERFIGILIEHHAGNFPIWLAPIQVVVLNITDGQAGYGEKVTEALRKSGVRAVSDLSNSKITYKIREHSLQRLPYILVVGDKEMATESVAVRARGNRDLGVMSIKDFTARLAEEVQTRV